MKNIGTARKQNQSMKQKVQPISVKASPVYCKKPTLTPFFAITVAREVTEKELVYDPGFYIKETICLHGWDE
jgi:hypothetical protein